MPDRQSGRSSGVEHNLAKVGVEGSNPFARSSFSMKIDFAERQEFCRWAVRADGILAGFRWAKNL